MSIKMYGVPRKKLQTGHENIDEMDIMFNNPPIFFCPDMVCFSALVMELVKYPPLPIPSGKYTK